jgi:2,4-dienoyl-CoA reductase-like NADH-dependent reductase (Old Yellow Enzyme family)/nucleotide-binding universal stress UspA family protein
MDAGGRGSAPKGSTSICNNAPVTWFRAFRHGKGRKTVRVEDGEKTRRQHIRKERFAQIEGLADGARFYATIQNLSLGGMCFDVDFLFRTGRELKLEFKVFDRDIEPVTVEATIVWVEPVYMLFHRVGVRFKALSSDAARVIKRFVSDLQAPVGEDVVGADRYPFLFSPFGIGGVALKNRLTMAPMFWGYANEDGTVGEPLIDSYKNIALGGVGMIVVANAVVDSSGTMASRVLRVDEDRFLPGLTQLAETIRSAGAVACLQINHAGRWAGVDKPMTPSPSSVDFSPEIGALDSIRKELSTRHQMRLVNKFLTAFMRCRKGMTAEEICAVQTSFGRAALRAKEAGFDMVELHGATGYLLAQFLSPRSNRRKDNYGGSLENRMRFPLEVVQTVKTFVGEGFPVGYRFLADEWLAGGFGFDEAEIFARHLEKQGIAYLSVTAGTYESFFLPHIMNRSRKEGYLASLAGKIKGVVPKTPVIVAGRIIGPFLAEEILRKNDGDLIGLARPLFTDPQWPSKVCRGKEKDILFCRGCNTCLMRVINNEPVVCSRWDKLKRMDLDVRLRHRRATWEKILISMDDSENSLEAVEYAGHMIGRGKKVTLFSIVKRQPETAAAIEARHALLIQAQALLKATGMGEEDIDIKVRVEHNGIEEDILEELKEGGYGSIVLGRRGMSRTQQLLFGSISNYIVHHAKNCGVWVID